MSADVLADAAIILTGVFVVWVWVDQVVWGFIDRRAGGRERAELVALLTRLDRRASCPVCSPEDTTRDAHPAPGR